MATTVDSSQQLARNQLGLLGVIMPGVAQVAPAFNLFFTTGVMVALAGASAPLIFLISMVGMVATASSLAQFAGIYPSAGSFITYITRSIGTKVAVAIGVITILGYIIAFGGIYIFVGSYIVQNVFGDPHIWGITQLTTIVYGALVVAPVVVGLKFGVRITVVLYAFEVVLLLVLSVTILVRGGASGLSATPFMWPSGHSSDVLLAFSLAVLAFGGFEAAAPLAEETRNPRRAVPIAVVGAVVISGVIYVLGSYALVTAFGVGHAGMLAADANPFHTAAKAFVPFVAPLITWIFLSSVTSSYVAANTQTSRVIFAGARGGLWSSALATVNVRFRRPEHPDRGRRDRLHHAGRRLRLPRHVRHPRADHHVPDGQRGARGGVGQVPCPRHPQEHLALGRRAGHRRRGAGRPGLGGLAARPAQPVQHPPLADARLDRSRCRVRAGPRLAAAGCAEARARPAGR
jgi:amino acid transporter